MPKPTDADDESSTTHHAHSASGGVSRWVAPLALVIALIAAAGAGWALFRPLGPEPAGLLAVAANARLAMAGGATYLLARTGHALVHGALGGPLPGTAGQLTSFQPSTITDVLRCDR
jgi:hypothetical protein